MRVLKNAGMLAFGKIITITCRVAYIIIIARFLGPELYGFFSYTQAWFITFWAFTTLGLGPHIMNTIGGQRSFGCKIIPVTFSLVLLASPISAFIGFFTGILFEPNNQQTYLLFGIFAISLIARGFVRWNELILAAYEKASIIMRLQILYRTLELSFIILCAYLKPSLLIFASITMFFWWLQAAHGLWLIQFKVCPNSLTWTLKDTKPLLIIAFPLVCLSFLSEFFFQAPIILIKNLFGYSDDIGNIIFCLQALLITSTIPFSLSISALPAVRRSIIRNDNKDLWFMDTMIRLGLIGTLFLVIGTYLFGKDLIPFILGASYKFSGQNLWIAMLFFLPLTIMIALKTWTNAHQSYFISILATTLGVVSLIITFLLNVKDLGNIAILISIFCGYFTSILVMAFFFYRKQYAKLHSSSFNTLLITLLSAYSFYYYVQLGHPQWGGVFAVSFAILGIVLFCLTPLERSKVTAIN